MKNDVPYEQELAKAEAALADLKERGADAIGEDWDDLRQELYTPEENAECDLQVALIGEIIKARNERGITQKKLEELSGVKQPVIARLERGYTNPQINTVMKVLASLGKTLYIGDLKYK